MKTNGGTSLIQRTFGKSFYKENYDIKDRYALKTRNDKQPRIMKSFSYRSPKNKFSAKILPFSVIHRQQDLCPSLRYDALAPRRK